MRTRNEGRTDEEAIFSDQIFDNARQRFNRSTLLLKVVSSTVCKEGKKGNTVDHMRSRQSSLQCK